MSVPNIYDAELEAFFNFCASTEVNHLSPCWSPVSYFADTDGEDEKPLSIYDVPSQSQSNDCDSTYQITHSHESTPVSEWSTLSLEYSDSKSDISSLSSLSINPSFLVTGRNTPERVLHEEPAIDSQLANIAPPPHLPEPHKMQSLQSSPVKFSSPECPTIASSSNPSNGAVEMTPTHPRKRGRVETPPQPSRPRTRNYVRTIRQSSDKCQGSDSEYVDSDHGNDTDEVGTSSTTTSPRKRRKLDTPSKPARRIRCEEPFCQCTFTRPADLRRHMATLHRNLSRTEALKETRDEHRLWCKHCGVILGRVDARQRHESHGSCERSRAIMQSRIKNGTVRGRVSRGQLIK